MPSTSKLKGKKSRGPVAKGRKTSSKSPRYPKSDKVSIQISEAENSVDKSCASASVKKSSLQCYFTSNKISNMKVSDPDFVLVMDLVKKIDEVHPINSEEERKIADLQKEMTRIRASCAVERVFSRLQFIRETCGEKMYEDMTEVRVMMQCNGDLNELIPTLH